MALPWTKQEGTGTAGLTALGEQGDSCTSCGAGLAVDQRYCLNCGDRRAGPRLEFEKILFDSFEQPTAAAGAPAAAVTGYPTRSDWTPITAIGSIAVLGAMLLLGVLIGKDDDSTTQIAAAPATTAPVAAAPAPTTAATSPAAGKGAGAGAAAAAAPAEGIKGGSGTTEGIATASDPAVTGVGGNKEQQEASKKIPDQVATSGEPVAQDNKAPGGGSGASCIGC